MRVTIGTCGLCGGLVGISTEGKGICRDCSAVAILTKLEMENTKQLPMSSYNYIQSEGEVCPYCANMMCLEWKEAGLPDALSSTEIQVHCLNCDKEWMNIYDLADYRHIKKKE